MTESAGREIYLTNGCCEDVSEHSMSDRGVSVDLAGLGLEVQDGPDGYYPLSEREAMLIADDEIVLKGNPVPYGDAEPAYAMLMGYSTLKDGRKFLAPTVEHMFDPKDDDDYDRGLAEVRTFADAVRPAVEAAGGSVAVVEDGGPERHLVEFRIPMAYALENASDYESWVAHLKGELLAAGIVPEAPVPAGP